MILREQLSEASVPDGNVDFSLDRPWAETVSGRHEYPTISEEEARALTRIGEVIAASPNIGQVYEAFVQETSRLIDFDMIGITRRTATGDLTPEYVAGISVSAWQMGLSSAYAGSIEERIEATRRPQSWHFDSQDALVADLPSETPAFEAGLRSMLGVPLTYADEIVGFLVVASGRPSSFSDGAARRLRLIAGQIAGTVANCRLLAASQEGEKRYRSLAELSPDGIILHETSGVVYANLAAARLYGFETPNDLVGQGIELSHFVHKDYRELFENRRQLIYGMGAAVRPLEYVIVRRDGSLVEVEGMTTPVEVDGRPLAQSIIRDVSVRKKQEKESRRLTRENKVLAEIGKIMTGSEELEELYARFTVQVGRLLGFDQLTISVVDDEAATLSLSYISGIEVPEWRVGAKPWEGSLAQAVQLTGAPQVLRMTRSGGNQPLYQAELPAVTAGLRSQICVPLGPGDRATAFLTLSSRDVDAYGPREMVMATRVADQVAGAFATAQLLEESRESEERYRGLVELSPDAIVIHQERVILYANRAAADLLGLSDPDELIGADIGEFVEPDYWSLFVDRLRSLYTEGEKTGVDEFGLVRADGAPIYVEAVSAPAQFGGMTVGQTILNDVTNRREAETTLWRLGRENEVLANLGKIVASSPYIEDVLEEFSRELRELVRFDGLVLASIDRARGTFTASHVVGMQVPGLDPGSVHSITDHAWKGSMEAGRGDLVVGDEMLRRREKSAVHKALNDAGINSLISVPLVHQGELRGFLSIGSILDKAYTDKELDISQRVAQQIGGAVEISRLHRHTVDAEKALRSSEGKLFDLFENAPVAYHEADLDGTILRVNRTSLEMFGYAEEEMVGRSILDFIVESEEVAVNIERFHRGVTPEATMWERTVIAKNGTFVPVLVSVKLQTDSEGNISGHLATMQDVSERKRLEDQLLRSQKMDALGKLAGGIAHDFNNLLTGMMLQAGIARNAVPSDRSQAEAGLDEIVKIAQRASQLTRQLLTFSRSQMLHPTVCQPNDMVADMHSILRRLIGEHIELVLLLEDNAGPVSIDPSQFEQVLVNLVLNARDAMQDGGKITISTRAVAEFPVEIGSPAAAGHDGNGYLALTVSDNGRGMTDDVKSRAFEPFFTTKEVGQGTGLGLATCYGIIAQSGGVMDLKSEVGIGTTFNIFLPICKDAVSVAERSRQTPLIAAGTETVLLVEDEPAVRGALVAVLVDNGYKVLEAANGHEALSIFDDQERVPIDIVVTDVVMPLMGGKELAERVRREDPSMRILFTSGYNEDQGSLLDGPEGITGFIHKPFLPLDLVSDVRALLD